MTLSPGFCRGLLQLDITSAVLEAAAGEVGCAEGGKGSLQRRRLTLELTSSLY